MIDSIILKKGAPPPILRALITDDPTPFDALRDATEGILVSVANGTLSADEAGEVFSAGVGIYLRMRCTPCGGYGVTIFPAALCPHCGGSGWKK